MRCVTQPVGPFSSGPVPLLQNALRDGPEKYSEINPHAQISAKKDLYPEWCLTKHLHKTTKAFEGVCERPLFKVVIWWNIALCYANCSQWARITKDNIYSLQLMKKKNNYMQLYFLNYCISQAWNLPSKHLDNLQLFNAKPTYTIVAKEIPPRINRIGASQSYRADDGGWRRRNSGFRCQSSSEWRGDVISTITHEQQSTAQKGYTYFQTIIVLFIYKLFRLQNFWPNVVFPLFLCTPTNKSQ